MLFPTMLLTSCGIGIPGELLKDCAVPYLKDGPVVNQDIIDLAIEREFALKSCNVDKKALREFVKKHPKLREK
ncbi:hypothetical protein [Stenotrophomonas phage vB_SmaS_P15]|uniref:O-spanin n=3 Tax=root TaxID=1 RepID=A0AAE8YK29_9CAUD|nr:hypothetical protein [Stenotrophomonas phage vB_SmaS_P15]